MPIQLNKTKKKPEKRLRLRNPREQLCFEKGYGILCMYNLSQNIDAFYVQGAELCLESHCCIDNRI